MKDIVSENQTARDPLPAARLPGLDDDRRTRGRFRWWMIWAFLAVLSALVVLKITAVRKAEGVQYKTQPARSGGITVTVSATGNLEPTNQVEIGSELSGTVRTVEVDYNDRVQAGQVLAHLDTARLKAQVLQSKASLASARSALLEAQATVGESRSNVARLKHVSSLSGGRAVSRQDLDAAEAALERAKALEAVCRAAISQAQANLEINETDLSKAVIRSPIDGMVLSRSVEPGQTVAASLQAPVLFILAEDLTRMELHIDVDEADVGLVHAGQTADFTVDAYPDRRFPASVRQVRFASQTVDGVVTYETVLTVDNHDLTLRPGMTATADIVVAEVKEALLVPNAALRFQPSDPDGAGTSASSGGILQKILPRPPRSSPKKIKQQTDNKKDQQVWIIENGVPTAIPVTVGLTDGLMTALIAGDVRPGMELVVEQLEKKR
ncbi:efflux RND transporter periplasmic adaptor subunit [Desulfatiglans anilini]|uniref:efflux RND transporter periplasmic adaptor subunit n=1 Tax=Desulfatiglans anilini TaxID=90728 RepID=UPI000684A3EA|nr:efflux RND transporter periplasmic adaptor subunit [Desulfatiglans anilini]